MTPNRQRRVKSISEDVDSSVTSGKKKPSKHLKLGLTVKSLSGSKRLIEVLTRLGHYVSYNVVEELETELTHSVNNESIIVTPHYYFIIISHI